MPIVTPSSGVFKVPVRPPPPAQHPVPPPPPPHTDPMMQSPLEKAIATQAIAQPPPLPPGATHSAEVIAEVPVDPTAEVLDDESLRLLQVLDPRTALHVDSVAARAQLTAATALRKLLELELRGLVVQRPGKYFLRR
jgi:hypothetical protein